MHFEFRLKGQPEYWQNLKTPTARVRVKVTSQNYRGQTEKINKNPQS
jgi:hypothetical protein